MERDYSRKNLSQGKTYSGQVNAMNEAAITREQKQKKRFEIPVQLAVSKRFGMYKDEDKKEIRVPEIVHDQTFIRLQDAWQNVRWKGHYSEFGKENYSAVLASIKGIQYSSKDVEKFSAALAVFQESDEFSERVGYFLSCLINSCHETDFTIHTRQLNGDIAYLGLYNVKNIIVNGNPGEKIGHGMIRGRITLNESTGWMPGGCMEGGEIVIHGDGGHHSGQWMDGGIIIIEGDAGAGIGEWMKNGQIIVEGNAWKEVGHSMKGGKIIVKGNAGCRTGISMDNGEIIINGDCGYGLGNYMSGGRITVNGSACKEIGYRMKGGEIHIEGDIGKIGEVEHGKIYHKGKLIVKK